MFRDFSDLLSACNAHGVEHIVVDEAWRDRVETHFGGEPTAVLSLEHLLVTTRATGRLRDRADVEQIEAPIRRRRDEAP